MTKNTFKTKVVLPFIALAAIGLTYYLVSNQGKGECGRWKSCTTEFVSHIKQLSTSQLIYAKDNDDQFPPVSSMPSLRAALFIYSNQPRFFDSINTITSRPEFNFNLAGVAMSLPPYPGAEQLEPKSVGAWQGQVFGQYPTYVVGFADSHMATIKNPEQVIPLFTGQFDRKGVVLAPADYLTDEDPLK